MEKANKKQTILGSKHPGVTAWTFLANNALKLLSRTYIPLGSLSLASRTSMAGTRRDVFLATPPALPQ
jgi:hypothetical protein